MPKKLIELILMALFFGCCLWANAGEAADLPAPSPTAPTTPNPELIAQNAIAPLMTFQTWKTQRIQIAQNSLSELEDNPKSVQAPGELARQMEYNLEVAHGLTISDYFALYLKNKTPEEIQILAKTLTTEEVTALLLGYKKLSGMPQMATKAQGATQDTAQETLVVPATPLKK